MPEVKYVYRPAYFARKWGVALHEAIAVLRRSRTRAQANREALARGWRA